MIRKICTYIGDVIFSLRWYIIIAITFISGVVMGYRGIPEKAHITRVAVQHVDIPGINANEITPIIHWDRASNGPHYFVTIRNHERVLIRLRISLKDYVEDLKPIGKVDFFVGNVHLPPIRNGE